MDGSGSDGHDVLFLDGHQLVNVLHVLVRELLDLRFQIALAVFRDDVVRLELFGGVHAGLAGAADAPAGADAAPELPPFWDGPPELPKPPKAKVGLLILYILFGLVICLPVTVALTGLALGIFVLGGAGIGLGALLASFCFLGMNVVADILLLAGAALVAAALGLLLLFFAVWFFLRGVVGFADLIIRKGRDWCYEHGEVDA